MSRLHKGLTSYRSCIELPQKQFHISIFTILSDCHILDEINNLLNAFRLKQITVLAQKN